MGQGRLIWGAIRAGAIAFPPAALTAWFVRGAGGVAAVAAALGLVVTNLVASGLALQIGRKKAPGFSSLVALPSYAVRMLAMFVAIGACYASSAIDHPTFTVAFAVGVVGILVYECILYQRMPLLAIEFGKER